MDPIAEEYTKEEEALDNYYSDQVQAQFDAWEKSDPIDYPAN